METWQESSFDCFYKKKQRKTKLNALKCLGTISMMPLSSEIWLSFTFFWTFFQYLSPYCRVITNFHNMTFSRYLGKLVRLKVYPHTVLCLKLSWGSRDSLFRILLSWKYLCECFFEDLFHLLKLRYKSFKYERNKE